MDLVKLSGAEKAAIFLVSLGEDLASQVIQHLETDEIKKIGALMPGLKNVPSEVVDQVTQEIYNKSQSGAVAIKGSEEYLKNLITKALDPTRAAEIIEELSNPEGRTGIDTLKWLDPESIANYLKNEHPQITAVILSQLEPGHASDVLKALPEQLRSEITVRIATLPKIPSDVLKDINAVLQAEFKGTASVSASTSFSGKQKVADMLNQLDKTNESIIMSQIEENSPELADEIRQLMFKFEDLAMVDDKAIQEILKEVSNEDLTLALRTATEEVKNLIFKNMSERAATMLQEDMDAMGPVRVSDVEKAQMAITKIAKKLEGEGRIILSGGDDILV